MNSDRGALTALHLFMVWALMAAVVPTLGVGLAFAAWGGGAGGMVSLLALGLPLVVALLVTTGMPARTLVPMCGSVRGRLGWAVLVFALGTMGVLAGLAAYDWDVPLGNSSTRIALTGVPYAVAAAFFVPSRWVRVGATAALAAAVAYGGFVGPAQAQQRRHEAQVARYRERPELLYLGDAPPGMRVSHAQIEAAGFIVDYRPVREGPEFGYVGLVVRPSLTPMPRCPEPADEAVTCTVDAHGEMLAVRDFPRLVTLTRRHGKEEVEVSSQALDEAGLRRLLDTLHPLSDGELETLMRDGAISHSL
ncbi:hypothetical protein [Streptomyces sp. NBC_01565]|uniref:hypothetical protein n=1 Tax=unclassified Streptomyces TaxID=2593676 RepID=UPI002253B770|nr:hypothetical protein [Streptomyces sp. NBC_01565]MCX4545795.1 hypothetical protein [Streptomyces sp. NBC_01565]